MTTIRGGSEVMKMAMTVSRGETFHLSTKVTTETATAIFGTEAVNFPATGLEHEFVYSFPRGRIAMKFLERIKKFWHKGPS